MSELRPLYVKLDLTRESLASFPELAQIAKREGASRTAAVVWTTDLSELEANQDLALYPTWDYAVVKAPTLDGTELWIVPQAWQKKVELAAGFGKVSTPLLTFKGARLQGRFARFSSEEEDYVIAREEAQVPPIASDSHAPRGKKCAQCWTYRHGVGQNQKHPELCEHCAWAVEAIR